MHSSFGIYQAAYGFTNVKVIARFIYNKLIINTGKLPTAENVIK